METVSTIIGIFGPLLVSVLAYCAVDAILMRKRTWPPNPNSRY
jgi:hypothetical protein